MFTAYQGAGLGLRRSSLPEFFPESETTFVKPAEVDFFEVAPENWIDQGGYDARRFANIAEQVPIICHGLSLNLGGQAPLSQRLLHDIRAFMRQHRMTLYTEHLSYTADDGQLYDLLPLPRCRAAVDHVVERILQVQDILQQRIGIENASAYTGTPLDEMSEWDFYTEIAKKADCYLHLDVNNIYVNSVNFNYSPHLFLDAVAANAADRVVYIHTAGHYQQAKNFLIDTHGAPVCDPVWQLLDDAYQRFGAVPTLLERDFNIPAVSVLCAEVRQIAALQAKYQPNNKPTNAVNTANVANIQTDKSASANATAEPKSDLIEEQSVLQIAVPRSATMVNR